jgi:hypothetical protein
MKPVLENTWKLDFPIWRNNKSIKARPREILLIIRPCITLLQREDP